MTDNGPAAPGRLVELQTDPALQSATSCLWFLCREESLGVGRDDLHQELEKEAPLDLNAAVRCGKRAGLSLDIRSVGPDELRHPHEPVLMQRRDGRFVLVAAIDDERAWLLEPRTGNARAVPREPFINSCDGQAAFWIQNEAATFTLQSVVGHVLRNKVVFGPLVAASFFVSLLGFVYPLVFLIIIDKVISNRGAATLDVLIGSLLFFLAFEAVLRGARHFALRRAVRDIDRSLMSRLVRHALELPVSFYLRHTAVDTLSRIEELRRLRKFLTDAVVFVFVDVVFVLVFLALMFNFSLTLSLVVLASLPLYIAPAFVAMPTLRRKRKQTRTSRRDSNEAILDTFSGIETVKGAEHPQEGFLSKRIDEAFTSDEDSQNLRTSMTQYNQFVNRLAIAGLLWFGASMVLDGELTLGQLVAINILNMRFSQPMMRLCLFVYDFSQLRSIMKEVGEILDEPTEQQAGNFIRLSALEGAISFHNVSFRYPDTDRKALDGITFRIAPGETVGIVGPSGSGKSTIARLIRKLHVATGGRLLLDGVDAAILDPAWLRNHIGAVDQDYPIFRRSVADNIALGPGERHMARVMEAAETACAHDFITRLPNGYATKIGSRGAFLSGGEKQRLALARALFHSDSVLILDEATSSLDHEDEYRIQENVRQLTEGRTVIVIAHRLSALRHADRIITLDEGKIIEEGSPAELAHRDGYFAEMVLKEANLVKGFAANRLVAAGVGRQ